MRHVACGVHIRRKFAELVKAAGGDRKARAAGSLALQARERIDLICHADASVAEGDPEARRLARLEDVGPLVESCGKWLAARAGEAMPRSALAEAFSYALDYWPLFANFLEDGRLPLSNNLSERRVKPFVICRKNFLFYNTPRGAQASCAAFSVVQSALENGLSPRAYIEWLLAEMPNAGRLTDEALDGFMPWSASVPPAARIGAAAAGRIADEMCEAVAELGEGREPSRNRPKTL